MQFWLMNVDLIGMRVSLLDRFPYDPIVRHVVIGSLMLEALVLSCTPITLKSTMGDWVGLPDDKLTKTMTKS